MANEIEPINTEELKTRMERAKKHYSNKKLWDKLYTLLVKKFPSNKVYIG